LTARLGVVWPRPVLARVHEACGGYPLFALEIARFALARGSPHDPTIPLEIPDTLDGLLGVRLSALPDPTRRALVVVAALGAPTMPLARSAGVERRALDAAIAAGIVEVVAGRVRFSHPLFASRVYSAASAEERRGAHARSAAVVGDPVSRARHLAQAGEGADEHLASQLEAGARLARQRGAAAIAAELSEASAVATPRGSQAAAQRRLLAASRDHLEAGSVEHARTLARGLIVRARSGRVRAEALAALAEIEQRFGALDECVRYRREALTFAARAPKLQLLLHQRLALSLRITEGLASAEKHAEAALALSRRVGDEGSTARALSTLAVVRFNRDDPGAIAIAEDG
jgi:hypothetical protein